MERRIEIKVPHDNRGADIPSRAMLRFYMELASWLKLHPFTDLKLEADQINLIHESLRKKKYSSLRVNLPAEAYEYWRRIHYSDRWAVLVTVTQLGEYYKKKMLSPAEIPTKDNAPQPMSQSFSSENTDAQVLSGESDNKIAGHEGQAEGAEEDENEDLRNYVPSGMFQTS